MSDSPLVSVIMGSKSDWPVMEHASKKLDEMGGVRPMGSSRAVSRPKLARLVAMAAVVGNVAQRKLILERSSIPVLGVLVGRRLRALPGEHPEPSWPDGTLEAAIHSVVVAAGGGIDIGTALRNVVMTGRRLRPDAVGFVEQSLRARGIDSGTEADADAVHRMLADFREREPDMWVELRRQVDRALRLPLARHALLASDRPELGATSPTLRFSSRLARPQPRSAQRDQAQVIVAGVGHCDWATGSHVNAWTAAPTHISSPSANISALPLAVRRPTVIIAA